MNDKALYQLERAIDALTEMAKYLREDIKINISTNVKYDEHMGVFAPYLGLDEDPYSYYKPKDDSLVDLS